MGKWSTYQLRGGGGAQVIPIAPPSFGLSANPVIPGLTFTVDAECDDDQPPGSDGYMAGFSDTPGGPYVNGGPQPTGNPITSLQFGWGDTVYVVCWFTLAGVRVSANSAEQSITHP